MTSGRPLIAPAQIRHKSSLRRRDLVNVKVFPGDGRALETFAFDAQELRRFAWAILADFDPEEAKACAAENGEDISDLIGKARVQNVFAKPAPRREAPIVPGTDPHRVLAEIGRLGEATMGDLRAVPLANKTGHKALVHKLRVRGLVERTNEGRQGSLAQFELTEAGRDTLQHTSPPAAAATGQALAA